MTRIKNKTDDQSAPRKAVGRPKKAKIDQISAPPAKPPTPVQKPAAVPPPPLPTAVPSDQPALKKKRKIRPGSVAKRDVKRLQKGIDFLIPRAAFARLVREIASEIPDGANKRWQASAIETLQELAECHVTGVFFDANENCKYRGGKTVTDNDIRHTILMRKKTENMSLSILQKVGGGGKNAGSDLATAIAPDNGEDDDDDDDDDSDVKSDDGDDEDDDADDDDDNDEEGEDEAE